MPVQPNSTNEVLGCVVSGCEEAAAATVLAGTVLAGTVTAVGVMVVWADLVDPPRAWCSRAGATPVPQPPVWPGVDAAR